MMMNHRKMMTRENFSLKWRRGHLQQKQEFCQQNPDFKSEKSKRDIRNVKKKKVLEQLMFSDGVSTSTSEFKVKKTYNINTAQFRAMVTLNRVVLKEIMTYLNLTDLKSIRVVCKEWNRSANIEIRKRNCCYVLLSSGRIAKQYDHLENFKNLTRRSIEIPCSDFHLNGLDDSQIEVIASVFGQQIKTLKIDNSTTSNLFDLLNRGMFPILENLYGLDRVLVRKVIDVKKIPTLKKIVMASESGSGLNYDNNYHAKDAMLYNLIMACPNLKEVYGISINGAVFIPSEFWASKSHIFKSVVFGNKELHSRSQLSVNEVTVFANEKPKLEGIIIEHIDQNPEYLTQVYKILKSSQNSLKILETCLLSFPNIEYPPSFSQLSTLKFHITRERNIAYYFDKDYLMNFPTGSSLQQSLPNLKTVEFNFSRFQARYHNLGTFLFPFEFGNNWENFPSLTGLENNLKSVINLVMTNVSSNASPPSTWFDYCSAVFPNIQNIFVDKNWISGIVFETWPNLRSIKNHNG